MALSLKRKFGAEEPMSREEQLFWAVFRSRDLRGYLFSFHTPGWYKWDVLVERLKAATTGNVRMTMNCAAQLGQLAVLQWVHKHRPDAIFTWITATNAAENGHLHVLQWMHDNAVKPNWSTCAMDYAAENGRLHVLQWLHENRREGCTDMAMVRAARAGHLDVMKWLHANRREPWCMETVLQHARPHPAMTQWLRDTFQPVFSSQ